MMHEGTCRLMSFRTTTTMSQTAHANTAPRPISYTTWSRSTCVCINRLHRFTQYHPFPLYRSWFGGDENPFCFSSLSPFLPSLPPPLFARSCCVLCVTCSNLSFFCVYSLGRSMGAMVVRLNVPCRCRRPMGMSSTFDAS